MATIIILPVLSVALTMAFHRFTSAQRVFVKGSRRLKNMQDLSLSETDWKIIHEAIADISNDKQACLIAQNTVVISTFPEIKDWTRISEEQIWTYIKETSGDYFYQFETPPLGTSGQRVFLISRLNKDLHLKERRGYTAAFIIFMAFIGFCTAIIVIISRSITNSITLLKDQTKKIADGDLNVKIAVKLKKENEITSMSQSLDRMRISLKEAQARRSRFVMGISHDLRTPIAVIKGYAEAMSDGMLSDGKQKDDALAIILEKTGQLETMVDTLLSYEKLSTDEWKTSMEKVDLKEFLKKFSRTAATTATVFKRNVSFAMDMEETTVNMNPQLVQRALDNIFSNALRYTQDGDSILLSAVRRGCETVISISDTGCGIEESELENIFDLFYRGSSSRREEGMGIGLSVVKNIIDMHGWKVGVKSTPGEGTEFSITIPCGVKKDA